MNVKYKSSRNNTSLESVKMIKYYFYTLFLKISYFILIILSIISMKFSVLSPKYESFIRNHTIALFKPLYIMAEIPFNLTFDFNRSVKNILLANLRNKRLVEENLLLKDLYLKSLEIKKENENLKKILNYIDHNNTKYKYVVSRIYTEPKLPMINSIIINVGSDDGVKEGDLVLGITRNVIGRIINIDDNVSKVLLLNDANSNIPARTAETNEKFILSGTNRNYLEISHYNSKTPQILDGDIVYTSGDSKILPDGIPIGKIKKENKKIKVIMDENVNNIYNVIVMTRIE